MAPLCSIVFIALTSVIHPAVCYTTVPHSSLTAATTAPHAPLTAATTAPHLVSTARTTHDRPTADPTTATPAPPSLRQVHVLFRHGDRAPMQGYPNIPTSPKQSWPNGFGHLTQGGIRRQQRFGRWLRTRYDSLLSPHWDPAEIEVLSTDVDRTINSAEANLQGLYSSRSTAGRFDSSLDWSPVPVRILPTGYDYLLNVDNNCPRIYEEADKLLHLPIVEQMGDKCEPLYRLLSTRLGAPVDNLLDMAMAYDYFAVLQQHNMTVPDWVAPHLHFMKELQALYFELLAYNDVLKMLRGGPLISKIISDMESKTRSPSSTPNVLMYSAHDDRVAINLETLGVYNHMTPPYAAAVMYELHYQSGGYYVRLFYRNDTNTDGPPLPLTLPYCSTACPLQQFRQLLQHVLPTDYKLQCRTAAQATVLDAFSVRTLTARVGFRLTESVSLILLSAILITVVVIIVLLLSWRRRFNKLYRYSMLSQG